MDRALRVEMRIFLLLCNLFFRENSQRLAKNALQIVPVLRLNFTEKLATHSGFVSVGDPSRRDSDSYYLAPQEHLILMPRRLLSDE